MHLAFINVFLEDLKVCLASNLIEGSLTYITVHSLKARLAFAGVVADAVNAVSVFRAGTAIAFIDI